MKRITLVLVMLLMSVALFAQVSGTASTETVFDADAETLKETVDTSIAVGPVTVGNKFTFADVLAEEVEIDWALKIAYALNDAITFGATTGVALEVIPLTLSAGWVIADWVSVSAKYANANLAPPEGDEATTGTFTLKASFSF